jgi:hypothetical protein
VRFLVVNFVGWRRGKYWIRLHCYALLMSLSMSLTIIESYVLFAVFEHSDLPPFGAALDFSDFGHYLSNFKGGRSMYKQSSV